MLLRRDLLTGLAGLAALPLVGCGHAPASSPAGVAPSPAPLAEAGAVPPPAAPLPTLAPEDLAWINRLSFGVNGGTVRAYAQQGRQEWLQNQLAPPKSDGLPQALALRVAGMTIATRPVANLAWEMQERRRESESPGEPANRSQARRAWQQEMNRLEREAATRQFWRSLYSPHQLREQMVWFWGNHFSIHGNKRELRALVGDYEETALRPHALGRFQDLLVAASTHAAMLRYLDNDQNSAGRINENFARELMELHTLGVNGGYAQKDVQELARLLTGLGVASGEATPRLREHQMAQYRRQGLTEFNPARHDNGPVTILGVTSGGKGWDDIVAQLQRFAFHPSTARHLSRKIARFLMADEPPAAVVERMATAYLKADTAIAPMLQALFESPEFAPSLGRKFKDPQRWVLSSLRLVHDDRLIVNPAPALTWLQRLGQAPWGRVTPDGYPMQASAWSGSGQLGTRFEIARAIGGGTNALFRAEEGGPVNVMVVPALVRLEQAPLVRQNVWPVLSAETRSALAEAGSPAPWNALLLSSPEFMRC